MLPIPRPVAERIQSIELSLADDGGQIIALDDDQLSVELLDQIRDAALAEHADLKTSAGRDDHQLLWLAGVAEGKALVLQADTGAESDTLDQAVAILTAGLTNTALAGIVWSIGNDYDDRQQPWLVTEITGEYPERPRANDSGWSVRLVAAANTVTNPRYTVETKLSRMLADAPWTFTEMMQACGIVPQGPILADLYRRQLGRFETLLAEGTGTQMWAHGPATISDGPRRSHLDLPRCKAVLMTDTTRLDRSIKRFRCPILPPPPRRKHATAHPPLVPRLPLLLLDQAKEVIVDVDHLDDYTWRDDLADKIVLPAQHADLLDVLTTDLDELSADMIDGKTNGNMILCKGMPGVGKTLTAEVYAETIHQPLLTVRAATLGTTASSVESGLARHMAWATDLHLVLLIDEADAYLTSRGDDLAQNAVLTAFLRAFEHYAGLVFLTTNRPDSIDEAILSRCAAIIDYTPPSGPDLARVWHVQASIMSTTLEAGLVDELVTHLPTATPRDVKMLLRLALRMSRKRHQPLTTDLVRTCATFRGLTWEEPSRWASNPPQPRAAG